MKRNTVSWVAFSGLFLTLFVPSAFAGKAKTCGVAVIAATAKSPYELVLSELKEHPEKFVGGFKIRRHDGTGPVRRVILLRSGYPSVAPYMWMGQKGAGNDSIRWLSDNRMILDFFTAMRGKLFKCVENMCTTATAVLLMNEVLNPGVFPNNLPMIPILVGGFVGPRVVANLISLKHRISAGRTSSMADLVIDLGEYLKTMPDRRGFFGRRASEVARIFRRPPTSFVQIIDLTAVEYLLFNDYPNAIPDFMELLTRQIGSGSPELLVQPLNDVDTLELSLGGLL